jgi:hypothetical protein
MSVTITGADNIARVRLIVLRHRMYLELIGIRFRLNTFVQVRREFNLKGRRLTVYHAFCKLHGFADDFPVTKESLRASQDS